MNTWKIDPTHSEVNFKVKHLLVSTVTGTFNKFDAKIVTNREDFSDAKITFEAEVNSISTKNDQRDGHLKSPDFFDAVKYPKSTFVITSISPIATAKTGEATHKVKGNLTIKDKTNEIAFDAIVNIQPDKITCTGTAAVDRSKFDVRYGSKAFFPDIGDKIIYDEFRLKFNLIAVK